MNADGSDLINLTNTTTTTIYPVWFPPGAMATLIESSSWGWVKEQGRK